jgi:carbon-monoxide dehydrogenase medium subunit
MKGFDYLRPDNLDDAFLALKEHEHAFLLAGGTDLLVGVNNRSLFPKLIIDLKDIPNMNSLKNQDGWSFGSLMTIREIEVSKPILENMPFLCQAASSLGSVQIRNRATVGGNLCNASPAADMATMFLAMDARLRIVSSEGEQVAYLDQFFLGPNHTILSKGDVLTEITVPAEMDKFRGVYMKFAPRKGMDIGIVNVAIVADPDLDKNLLRNINIALGAVAPTPIRAREAEEIISGNTVTPDLIERAAEAASNATRPISDFRASASYRKEVVKVLVRRGINTILGTNTDL